MLAMSDTPIQQFIPLFAELGIPVAFLVPTPTGHEKSIMDAIGPVRELLLSAGIHDYEVQKQGPQNKVIVPAHFVGCTSLINSEASLYRPITKKGDPRIWFTNLKRYCNPYNLLALVVFNGEIYVFNLSKPEVACMTQYQGFAYSVLQEIVNHDAIIVKELLGKIKTIHQMGFLRSITPGDPGVGDTLEHALSISRNSFRTPDYKGIELKATRLTRNGTARVTTRHTLFTRVPDTGMSYHEILTNYGKMQTPRGMSEPRLQLYETFRCSRSNAYDLILSVDNASDNLNMYYLKDNQKKFVSAWKMKNLRDTLLIKHHETFWVKAVSENHDGVEYFRYDKVLHTKSPNVSLLGPLLENDTITVDLAAHIKPDGKYRDHGILFKIYPDDLPLLVGTPTEYIL